MLVLLLISRIVLEYIKAISKPTKIDVGRQSILMVCVKMITIFSSFCLFKLLNKFVVMPQTLKKFYGIEKKIGKASYLPQLMAWTVWLTSIVPDVRAIGYNFLQQLFLVSFVAFLTFWGRHHNIIWRMFLIVTINHHCLGIAFNFNVRFNITY